VYPLSFVIIQNMEIEYKKLPDSDKFSEDSIVKEGLRTFRGRPRGAKNKKNNQSRKIRKESAIV